MLVGTYDFMQVGDQTLGKIKATYGDDDGFLYITYSEMDVYWNGFYFFNLLCDWIIYFTNIKEFHDNDDRRYNY